MKTLTREQIVDLRDQVIAELNACMGAVRAYDRALALIDKEDKNESVAMGNGADHAKPDLPRADTPVSGQWTLTRSP